MTASVGSRSSGVLDGIRIVDFSRVFAAPAATQILGDLGADVIKIEEPTRGDEARYFGVSETTNATPGMSPSFVSLNRNKRSVALDLTTAAGRQAARKISAQADVVVHNFRLGAMEKWGLAYSDLKAINPRLIYCEFYAYGHEGPLRHLGANDLALQAHSGLMSITGSEDGLPARSGSAVVDLHAGTALAAAVLAALFHRERTGEGQFVETSLLRSSAHLMGYFYTEYWADGTVRKAMGTANHLSVPNQLFPTADGSVVIIAPSDQMWQRCARALDAARLDRPEFAAASDRRRLRSQVVDEISAVTRKLTSEEVHSRLAAVKVNVAKVNSVAEAADDPQLLANAGVVEMDIKGRQWKSVAMPFALASMPTAICRPPQAIGESTEEVLGDFGFQPSEIAALRAAGAFGSPAKP
jgi:crotonobetainyl-CoA:carnitine CoA-transferase CaiB-like acyl-CoA transferase